MTSGIQCVHKYMFMSLQLLSTKCVYIYIYILVFQEYCVPVESVIPLKLTLGGVSAVHKFFQSCRNYQFLKNPFFRIIEMVLYIVFSVPYYIYYKSCVLSFNFIPTKPIPSAMVM